MRQHIYIIDVSWGGHIPDYHRLFVQYYLNRNYFVTSISPNPNEISLRPNKAQTKSLKIIGITKNEIICHGLWGFIRSKVKKYLLKTLEFKSTYLKWFSKFIYTVQVWSYINHRVVKESFKAGFRPSLVLINCIENDFMVKGFSRFFIDIIFDFKWACLYLGPTEFKIGIVKPHTVEKSIFPPIYNILKTRSLKAILISDETLIPAIGGYAQKKVILLPEIIFKSLPLKETKLSEAIRKKTKGRKIICLLGALSERKGVELFIKVAQALLSSNYYFLMVGKVHSSLYNNKSIMKVLDAPLNNMYLHLEEIKGENAFNDLINISDIVFIAYKNFYHGSGILSRAAAFNKPVIASKGFLIGERVEKYNLGITIEEDNLDQCIAAIKIMTNNHMTQINSASKEYLNIHSISNFNKSLNKLVKIIGKG